MNTLSNIVGEICKTLLPIHEEVFFGNPKSSISICTLSSIQLLKEIANSTVMKKVAVVGRLLSENNGIDSIIQNVISNKKKSSSLFTYELYLYRNRDPSHY